MTKLAVYDPPMCCSTGVCGPVVDPVLPRIAADLDWLGRQGIQVERFNLAQQPQAFASNPAVTSALREHGNECLPLILVDGVVASRGRYPTRTEIVRLVGLDADVAGTPREAACSCCCSPGAEATIGAGQGSGKCC
ncbi:MAG: arsenite efflux transporter metallochaperone ArsD [Isosphaeraceae bacterium]